MCCPNCKSENIEKIQKEGQLLGSKFKPYRGLSNYIFICLKCGFKFTSRIEKRYESKNI
jgi:predicted Zn-ribbon and HTH transcriptional regulator